MAEPVVNLKVQIKGLAEANKILAKLTKQGSRALGDQAVQANIIHNVIKSLTGTLKKFGVEQKVAEKIARSYAGRMTGNINKIELLKAKLKDAGISIKQVTNWTNLKKKAMD